MAGQKVLISFREWLHSYEKSLYVTFKQELEFSSLSESGFIPTFGIIKNRFTGSFEFSSLSESGFIPTDMRNFSQQQRIFGCSHLFQRVASFLRIKVKRFFIGFKEEFSSLSESGFIPTSLCSMVTMSYWH